MTLNMLLAVAFGGAAGSVGRYMVVTQVTRLVGHGFPAGTVVVNLVGSFVMGLLIEILAQRWSPTPEMRAMLVVGVLGGFTTFSTFSLDVVTLIQRGAYGPAAGYLLVSVVLGVMALVGGLYAGRMVLG